MGLDPISQIFGYPLTAVESFLKKNDIDGVLKRMLRGINIDADLFNALKLRIGRAMDNQGRFNIEKFLFYLGGCASISKSGLRNYVEEESYDFDSMIFSHDDADYAGIGYCIWLFIDEENEHSHWINSEARKEFVKDVKKNKRFINRIDKKPNFIISWLLAVIEIVSQRIAGKEAFIPAVRTKSGLVVPLRLITEEDSKKYQVLREYADKEEKAQAHLKRTRRLREEKWLEKQALSEKILNKFNEQIIGNDVLRGSIFAEVGFDERFYEEDNRELKNAIGKLEQRASIKNDNVKVFSGKYRKIKFEKDKYKEKVNQKSAADFFGNMIKADEDAIFRKTIYC